MNRAPTTSTRAAKAVLAQTWRIVRGDTVWIRNGKDAGQTGVVTKVVRNPQRPGVIVEGKNLKKKHIKKTEQAPEGGIVTIEVSKESPIHYSNVALVDPVNGSPVRSAFRFLEDGTKVRVSVGAMASGQIIPYPEMMRERKGRSRPAADGSGDTPKSETLKVTYEPGEVWAGLKVSE